MTLLYLPLSGFDAKPWKNQIGTTHDIALLPKGSDHSNFELRFALSPVVKEGIFSAFPGIDRVITPVEGGNLQLSFDDTKKYVPLYKSQYFDSGLTPTGKPVGGEIKVINVMARRGVWQISTCGVEKQNNYDITSAEILFIFAIDECLIQSDQQAGTKNILLAKHDAALVTGSSQILLRPINGTRILCALLRSVSKS